MPAQGAPAVAGANAMDGVTSVEAPMTEVIDREVQGGTALSSTFPGSRRVYVQGSRSDLRVPVREVTLTASASESECAGSVETMSARRPFRPSAIARAAAHVVLPTPPFPP